MNQQELQALQDSQARLREAGAHHLADRLEGITKKPALVALAKEIYQGGYYQEAIQLYSIDEQI